EYDRRVSCRYGVVRGSARFRTLLGGHFRRATGATFHHTWLANPAVIRVLVLVKASAPCAGEEEQKHHLCEVVDAHTAHLPEPSSGGFGTARTIRRLPGF